MDFTKIIPEKKIVYTVNGRARYFMKHWEHIEVCMHLKRKKQRNCFLCSSRFADIDDTYLVLVEKEGGQVICKTCADKCGIYEPISPKEEDK